jgi:hypothetical protein
MRALLLNLGRLAGRSTLQSNLHFHPILRPQFPCSPSAALWSLQSANAMLCGRILLFLAKLLPLTERSGVNLGGSFNTDNATPVEDVQEVGAGCRVQSESAG